jgi:hypothetical protein
LKYNLRHYITAQLETLKKKYNAPWFRYGNQGALPTFEEFALIMDRAGVIVIPSSYLVFLLVLFGAAVNDNTSALGGLIPFMVGASIRPFVSTT